VSGVLKCAVLRRLGTSRFSIPVRVSCKKAILPTYLAFRAFVIFGASSFDLINVISSFSRHLGEVFVETRSPNFPRYIAPHFLQYLSEDPKQQKEIS
jgi:hypothetical protein